MQFFHYNQPFALESGVTLPSLTIGYHTFGQLNADRSNAIWICHALTSNSNVADWWPGIVGAGCIFDPSTHFIICANILGSCYGTTGPIAQDPTTGLPYYSTFPFIAIRDMVQAHILLRQHLNIEKIQLLVGGSMGGYQALEWAIMEKWRIETLFLLATSAAETPWGIAIHTAQRLAIEADKTWNETHIEAGRNGLKAARAIGMLSYRNYYIMGAKQQEPDNEKKDHFKASSYILHQGEKLASRFHAYTYWLLTKAMDTHNIARGRNRTIAQVLQSISQPTLVIAIASDILCPPEEQRFLAQHLPHATLAEMDSSYGHDGFLIEAETITKHYLNWMKKLNILA